MSDRYNPVQYRHDHDSSDFVIRSGPALNVADAVFLQDAGRTIDLETFTLLSKIAASQKYTSFIDETAVDGTATPAGIYLGPTIAAADIVAGDIESLDVLVYGAWFDVSRLIIEAAKTLETIVNVGTIQARTVRDYLFYRALIPLGTSISSGGEN